MVSLQILRNKFLSGHNKIKAQLCFLVMDEIFLTTGANNSITTIQLNTTTGLLSELPTAHVVARGRACLRRGGQGTRTA